jgi:hypothetical protein
MKYNCYTPTPQTWLRSLLIERVHLGPRSAALARRRGRRVGHRRVEEPVAAGRPAAWSRSMRGLLDELVATHGARAGDLQPRDDTVLHVHQHVVLKENSGGGQGGKSACKAIEGSRRPTRRSPCTLRNRVRRVMLVPVSKYSGADTKPTHIGFGPFSPRQPSNHLCGRRTRSTIASRLYEYGSAQGNDERTRTHAPSAS